MKQLILTLAIFFTSIVASAQALPPMRTVDGNVVLSQSDPNARIEILLPATYVGAVRFTLYDVADCEIHLFVDADEAKQVRRLYWVQFEAYLPEHPTLAYEHHPAYTPTELNGLPFYQRARFGQSTDTPKPGSDADRAYKLLSENGYKLPAETVNVTYKHFLGTKMRKEVLLMVIEDMALTGTSFSQLVKNNELQPTWAPIADKLLERSPKAFAISLK